ncbi:SpoIIE family protein phosphatase [Streptomyces sp. NPDC048638]|uniref:SpoIIE family protein phosphatase n=1 Tax=Streptomyces sp. NPDC048638 TaxID=3365580 RepID=UPI003718FB31
MITALVPIDHYSAVQLAADTAKSAAKRCPLPGSMPDQAAVVASELASNLANHAVQGALYIHQLALGTGIEIVAVDRGPGIRDVQECLADGYTTNGTLGAGLGAVMRIATAFTIRSQPGHGTVAGARLAVPQQSEVDGIGAVCVAADREQDCGDGVAAVEHEGMRTAVVVDGLGHGQLASEAARTALRAFHRAPDAPVPDILTTMHRALRHTRGAAVGVLRLDAGSAQYSGIGNIRALTLDRHDVGHRLTGQPGVVGLNMTAPRIHRFPLPPDATVVLHSDGVDHRWARTPTPFLHRLPPPLLAAAVLHDHRLVRDDATVLAVRPLQSQP